MIFKELYNDYQKEYKNLSKKELKKKRLEDFTHEWLDLLNPYFDIEYRYEQGCYIMTNLYKQGFTYYPGGDRLQIHTMNQWKDNGLEYLLNKAGK